MQTADTGTEAALSGLRPSAHKPYSAAHLPIHQREATCPCPGREFLIHPAEPQAARILPEILQLPLVLKEAEAIFTQLFPALLLQVSFTTELTLQEEEIFWEVLLESKWESLGLALVSSFHSDWDRVLLCNLLHCR